MWPSDIGTSGVGIFMIGGPSLVCIYTCILFMQDMPMWLRVFMMTFYSMSLINVFYQLFKTATTEPGIVPSLHLAGLKDQSIGTIGPNDEKYVRMLNEEELETRLPEGMTKAQKFYSSYKYELLEYNSE